MPIKSRIRTIPDFPKPGILFRDVTTLFQDPKGLRKAVDELVFHYAGEPIDKVAGIEARGFIVGAALAHQLSVGFIPLRKKGKLPRSTLSESYALEYGQDTIEMHEDAVKPGERVLLVDDLLATGGTALAGARLLRQVEGVQVVGAAFVVELPDLGGRAALEAEGVGCLTLVQFEGE